MVWAGPAVISRFQRPPTLSALVSGRWPRRQVKLCWCFAGFAGVDMVCARCHRRSQIGGNGLRCSRGALPRRRPCQKQARPAAAWHHLGDADVSFAWYSARLVLDSTNSYPLITHPLNLTDAASKRPTHQRRVSCTAGRGETPCPWMPGGAPSETS